MGITLELEKARKLVDECIEAGGDDIECMRRADREMGFWLIGFSYSTVSWMAETISDVLGEDVYFNYFSKILCSCLEESLEYDEKLYNKMIEYLKKLIDVADEELKIRFKTLLEFIKNALRTKSGIICSG